MRPERGRFARFLVLALVLLLAAPGATPAAPSSSTAPQASAEFVSNQLLVGFRQDTAEGERADVVRGRGGRLLRKLAGLEAYLVELPPGRPVVAEARAYAAERGVRYAEPNYVYRMAAAPASPPNDPGFGLQWALHNTGQEIDKQPGTAGADIAALDAWGVTTGSGDIVVGVVDTGIDYTHPDLSANVWENPGGVGGCPAGTHGYRVVVDPDPTALQPIRDCVPADDNGHGTHVAGTIGATGNNGVGVTGVNWTVKLMSLKFLDAQGTGRTDHAIEVIDFAIRARQAGVNLRVLNNSWAGWDFSQALLDKINQAGQVGILFVAAAGDSRDRDERSNDIRPVYPASYEAPNVLAVAATDNGDGLASFSNYGPTSVDLGAPGVGIYSTCWFDASAGTCTSGYSSRSGTSMATPHVAGAGALVLSAPGLGGLTVTELKNRLMYCGDANAALSAQTVSGRRLDAANAIAGCTVPDYTLTILESPGGSVTASPPGLTYPAGTAVTLTATADEGYRFTGWTIDGAPAGTSDSIVRVMDRSYTVAASFIRLNRLTLLTSGDGTASARASDGQPGPYYAPGTSVALSASPGLGQVFTGWTIDGIAAGAANPAALTMDADHTVVASFAPAPPPPSPPPAPSTTVALVVSAGPGGSATGEGSYRTGAVATLVATPEPGYVFTGWTVDGQFAGWAERLTITMAADHAVGATFAARPGFPDLPTNARTVEAIGQLAARGVIRGYQDGRFGPNDPTLRAQMAALIARAVGWDAEDYGNDFPDRGGVDDNLWRNVGTLAYYDVARGFPDGTYKPTADVLNVQVIAFISRAMVAKGYWQPQADIPALYPNVPASSSHREDLATYYAHAGAVPGTTPFAPWPGWDRSSTRAGFALAEWQALDSYWGVDRTP